MAVSCILIFKMRRKRKRKYWVHPIFSIGWLIFGKFYPVDEKAYELTEKVFEVSHNACSKLS